MTEENERREPVRRNNRLLIDEEAKDSVELGPIVGYAGELPLSLFDACVPLVDIVRDILNCVATAMKSIPEQPADGLTRDESAAICLYTMEWIEDDKSLYIILNRTLRTGDRADLRPWYKYLKLLVTAIVKIPYTQRQTVWRGIRQNVSDAFPRGTEVTWWSFSSCTTTLTILESDIYLGRTGERTLFSIEVFNARDVSAHSYFKAEDEVLLLPGTQMEVRSQLDPSPDLHIIHLRQIMPKKVLLEPPFEGAEIYPIIEVSKPRWYRRKKYYIPLCLIITACVIAIILGAALGAKFARMQSTKPSDGICATAQWIQSGVTVAGGSVQGQGLNQLNSPDGLFVLGNGTLYVVDSGNNRILRWDSGASSGYIVAGGNQPGNSSELLSYPVDVVVDNNGTMYMSDYNNNRVQQWFQGASTGQTLLTGFIFTGIGQDSEGFLYTSDWTNNQVTKWRVGNTTGQVLAFGMNWPDRMHVDRNNSIYVADRKNHRVVKIFAGTTETLVVAGGFPGSGANQLDFPRSVTTDASGNVYVADTGNNRIVRWLVGATSGTVVVGNGGTGSNSNQLNTPTDLQFDQDGNLYVSDSRNTRIQRFGLDKNSC